MRTPTSQWKPITALMAAAALLLSGCAGTGQDPQPAGVTPETTRDVIANYTLPSPLSTAASSVAVQLDATLSPMLSGGTPIDVAYYCSPDGYLDSTSQATVSGQAVSIPIYASACDSGAMDILLTSTAGDTASSTRYAVSIHAERSSTNDTNPAFSLGNANLVIDPHTSCGSAITDVKITAGPALPGTVTLGNRFNLALTENQAATLSSMPNQPRLWTQEGSNWRPVNATVTLAGRSLDITINDFSIVGTPIPALRLASQSQATPLEQCFGMNGDSFRGLELTSPSSKGTLISAQLERFAGADRYATSATVSVNSISGGSPVFIASGTAFPDALAAGPAAASVHGALLLTTQGSVPEVILAEVRRIAPREVFVLGAEASVSAAAVAQVTAAAPGATIERIAGGDRFETAARIADRFFPQATSYLLASGMNFPDALSATAAGSRSNPTPILLTAQDRLVESAQQRVQNAGKTDITLLGGESSLAAAVETSARAATSGAVTRLAGANRYETNVMALDALSRTPPSVAILATGEAFPDALSASMLVAATDGALILTTGTCHVQLTDQYLRSIRPVRALAVGSELSVSLHSLDTICS